MQVYFTPPGGSLTASVAHALQRASLNGLAGLGSGPSVNVRMPRAVPAAFGAARRMREQFAARQERTMTGMGILTPPTPNVTHARFIHAVPPPITFANPTRLRPAHVMREVLMQGLGAAARGPVAARAILRPAGPSRFAVGAAAPGFIAQQPTDVLTQAGQTQAIHRQAAIFMSPGGGYSQIPGFMPAIGPPVRRLSGLGRHSLRFYLGDDASSTNPPDVGTGTVPLGPLDPSIDHWQTQQPPASPSWFQIGQPTVPVQTTPSMAPPNIGATQVNNLPTAAANSLFSAFNAAQPVRPAGTAASTTLGVPTTALIGVAGLAVVLGVMSGGSRRRNPSRRRRARR